MFFIYYSKSLYKIFLKINFLTKNFDIKVVLKTRNFLTKINDLLTVFFLHSFSNSITTVSTFGKAITFTDRIVH